MKDVVAEKTKDDPPTGRFRCSIHFDMIYI